MLILTRHRIALLSAFAVAAAAAGCSSGGHGRSTGAAGASASITPSATTAAATGALDQITWDLPQGEPTTLDPAKAGDYSPNTVEANLCDTLLRMNPDYTESPGLAESWSWTDPTTLVLKIRSGVTFWDGNPLTAQDVAYSLNRQSDPATQGVDASYLSGVTSITAGGPLEVTLKFHYPDELFVKLLATEFGAVSEEAYVKKQGTNYGQASGGLMCTGPYQFGSWQSGQSISITANPHYWDPALKPKVKEVDFKFLSDSATLSSALLSGQIDGAYEVPQATMRALANSKVGARHYGISTQATALAVANSTTPLTDKRLDDALAMTLDYDAIVKNIYGGAATVQKTFIPATAWQSSAAKSVFQAGYDALPAPSAPDIAKAKALVDQVAPKQRTLTAATQAGDQSGLQILTFLQAGAEKIGLDLTIKQFQPVDFSNLFYDDTKRAGLDLVVAEGYLEVPDPLSYAPLLAEPQGQFNWANYGNDQVTSLLNQAQSTLEETKSAQLFTQAQAIYTKELPGIPLVAQYEQSFMNKRISGAPASFAYMNTPWAAMIGGTGQ